MDPDDDRQVADAPPPSGDDAVSRETAARLAARATFGTRYPLAERYADWLAGAGVVRGLVGPREASRLWERHLLNCAVVSELLEPGLRVADVGSGAGLPGIPIALAGADLRVTLIEPLLRRATFLEEVVSDLGLAPVVEVRRARAEELGRTGQWEVVTSRAVAPLPKLVAWCGPLVAPGGRILAIKGRTAADELESARPRLRSWGVQHAAVHRCGPAGFGTTVVELSMDEKVRKRG